MYNPEFAYLLGMIVGKGTIVRRRSQTEIRIEIPHKSFTIEKMDARLHVKASITDIKEILEPLINSRIAVSSSDNKTILLYEKNNSDFLIREINRHLKNLISCKDFRIPKDIFDAPEDIKMEFLRGIADVTGHIRSSNNAFGKPYHHRVYFEIPVNWNLAIDISNLLMILDIPVGTIDWGHPNIRDPKLEEYNKGKQNAWFREHQIKIFAEEFEKVGFKILHKMKALKNLSNANRQEWNRYVEKKINKALTFVKKHEWKKKLGHIEINHHKYYWERRILKRPKSMHPMENDIKIPEIIRGRHFDSWREIAKELGYPR